MKIEDINRQLETSGYRLSNLEAELRGLKGRVSGVESRIDEEVKTQAKLKKLKELLQELEL